MNEDIYEYIESHITPQPEYLKKIDRDTNLHELNGRMCSGHIQGNILRMLIAMVRPKKVLELGSFTGYSALCMAETMEPDGRIFTIEADEELEDTIIRNLASSPHGNKVTLMIGDALQLIKEFEPESFDLIMIDADKRQYCDYFLESLRVTKPGGFILADNTLWDGHVTETGKHSSQTEGIMKFNDLVSKTMGVEVAILPFRDGLTIIRKL